MYPTWGQFLLPEGLLANPVILKCGLFQWISLQPPDILSIHCNRGHSFCPFLTSMSEAFSIPFILYCTKALHDQALSLAQDWILLLWRPRIPVSFRPSTTTFQKDWCWSWGSNTLAPWCEELTLWKRPWCWERLKAGIEVDDWESVGWMTSPTWWTWVWASSGSCWWTGKPGMLQSMGPQRVEHDWATELDCLNWSCVLLFTTPWSAAHPVPHHLPEFSQV